jgi:hypothetical protein
MNFWIQLWTCVLVGGVIIFVLLAIVISVGGLLDIRSLFRTIERQHAEQDGDEDG